MSRAEKSHPVFRFVLHAESHPFAYLFAFQLGNPLQYIPHESAHGVRCVKLLLDRAEILLRPLELVHHQGEVLAVPVDPVHLQNQDDIPTVLF
ncbi:hypothetical protein SDC9_198572 [bioreactor metagenome]|uniref:Uncharacterized protein n=1 Tax=bioreactor metagenome TaxID=1076179 RepID=A0A645IJA5_9ZZZZ